MSALDELAGMWERRATAFRDSIGVGGDLDTCDHEALAMAESLDQCAAELRAALGAFGSLALRFARRGRK